MVSTASKIGFARGVASLLFTIGLPRRRVVRRRGVVFDLDLGEGIDLALFLFGRFQGHVVSLIERLIPPDGVMIDVGANIGAITLPAARALAQGRVYAMEPTTYAFEKLSRNIALNPQLAPRIMPVRTFVADVSRPSSDLIAYSSWPVDGSAPGDSHPVHRGVAKTADCGQITIDDFVRDFQALSLIKIDTDGHEFAVLRGAAETLRRFRPIVVFEACGYLMQPPAATFADVEAFLASSGYTIRDAHALQPLTAADFDRKCPAGGGLDLVAVPNERHL